MVRKGILALVVVVLSTSWAAAQATQAGQGQAGQGQAGQGQAGQKAIKLDGEWTVMFAEFDGKKVDNKGITNVMIKNNVVTCRHDGKEKSWKLEFGPFHMVRCTETDGSNNANSKEGTKGHHTHHGVYIASQDLFCLSMNKGMDKRSFSSSTEGRDREQQPKQQQQQQQPQQQQGEGGQRGNQGLQLFNQEPHGSAFIVVLTRSGAASSGR